MKNYDLFGRIMPDDFSKSLPKLRPAIKDDKPARSVVNVKPIELKDGAGFKASKFQPHTTFQRKGGAIAGATSCGRDAALGWGDVLPPSRGVVVAPERVPLSDKMIYKMGIAKSEAAKKRA
jgi:hypothetical protein